MRKIIGLIALVLLIGAGCSQILDNKKEVEVKEEEKSVNIVENIPEVELLDTSDWKTFENTKLGYTFKYPAEQLVGSSQFATDANISDYVHVQILEDGLYKDGIHKDFSISNIRDFSIEQDYLSLERYVNILWNMNYDDRVNNEKAKEYKLGNIEEVIVDGNQAFRFYIDGSRITLNNSGLIQNTYIYVFEKNNDDYDNKKYLVEVTNEPYGMTILNSLKFNE